MVPQEESESMTYYIVWSIVGLTIIGLMYAQWKFWLDDPALDRLIEQEIRKSVESEAQYWCRILDPAYDPYEHCEYQRFLNEAYDEIEELLA